MSFLRKKEGPLAILIITAFMMLLEFYFNIAPVNFWASELRVWVVILTSFSLIIGGYSLLRRITRNVTKRTPGEWPYDVFAAFLLACFIFAGAYYGTESFQWTWLFDNFYLSTRSTMYACGAFYVYSTFYRAVRARSFDSAVMLFFALIVMLGIAPIYGLISPGFLPIRTWLVDIGQIGVRRGFDMAVTVGLAFLTLRTMVGLETAAIGLIPGVEEA